MQHESAVAIAIYVLKKYTHFFSRKLHGKMHFYSVCVKVKNILDLSQHLISPDFIVQGATPLLFNLIYVNICKKYVCCEKKRRGQDLARSDSILFHNGMVFH